MRAVILGIALVACQVVLATNRTWTGLEENGRLDSAGNWDPADTPAAADNLSVTTVGASTNAFRIGGDLTVRTLTFAQGEQASGEVVIDLSGKTLKVDDGALNLPLALAAFSNGSLQVRKMVLGDGCTTAKATFADMSVWATLSQGWTAKATRQSEFEFFRCAVTNLPVFAQNTSVLLDGCDAGHVIIETSSGNVKGSLRTGKQFKVKTGSGSVSVPADAAGGQCEIRTTSGNVSITVG